MTVYECIMLVDSYEPNAYTVEQKVRWVRECEGKVITQVFLQQPIGVPFGSPYSYMYEELLVPAPYNKLYPRYLQAMIHYANGEYERYSASMQMFNEAWSELNRWFGRDYDIADRNRNRRITVRISPVEAEEPEYPETYTQVLLRIPPRCAFVAGRIVIKKPFAPPEGQSYDIQGNAWFESPDTYVGQSLINFDETGSSRIKMLIGDVGGSDIGITLINAAEGEAWLTGVLCLPEEEFFYRSESQREAGPAEYEEPY